MAQGLEVYDSTGSLLVGINNKLTRYIGEFLLDGSDLTQHIIKSSGFLTGTPFYSVEHKYFSSYPFYFDTFRDTYDTRPNPFFVTAGIAISKTKITGSIIGDTFSFKQEVNYTPNDFLVNQGILIKYGVM